MEGQSRVDEVKVLQNEIEDYSKTYGVSIEIAIKYYDLYYQKKIAENCNP